MRKATPINLTDTERKQLESFDRGKSCSVRLAHRSRIILLASKGLQNDEIGKQLGISRQMAGRWRLRYALQGLAGIEKDAPRPGRFPSIRDRLKKRIIRMTLEETPPNATHWSRTTMSAATGVSPSSIGRIWAANGLKPHLVKTFKLSNDKHFVEKLEDVIGLYLSPPEHAIVLSCDEKSQIQALDRTQRSLPLRKGRCGTMTHDYKRNGTTSLFAALNIMDGTVIGTCMKRHRHQEWIKFLNLIKRSVSIEKDIHIICDNYSTHKHERVKKWLLRNPRFKVHFTPTSASWLNMIERFFRDITANRLKRGVFYSVDELTDAIAQYIDKHNKTPKPFVWTATAHDILEKVKRGRAVLNKLQSA